MLHPSHGRIYEAISNLISRGHIADPITLKEYFDRDEALSEVGGLLGNAKRHQRVKLRF